MFDPVAVVLLLAFAALFGLGLLYLCLGRAGLRDLVKASRRNVTLSRFGVRHVFSTTAIVAVLLGFLRTLGMLESLAACIFVGVLLFPFALGIVYFFALLFSDCAELFVEHPRHRYFADSQDCDSSVQDAANNG